MRQMLIVKAAFVLSLLVVGETLAAQQKLLANDGQAEDQFGYSVAIDGGTALVGAFRADEGNVKDSGAAYVYTLNPEGWRFEAKLVANAPLEGDTLGGNLALKKDTAVLGVIGRDDVAENAGAVLVFERESGEWFEKQWLTAFDAKKGDSFGQSIALTDNTLVIGAPRSDASEIDSGSAYVFQRKNDQWQFQAKLTAGDGAEGDLFGISVAIDGNTILVGADLNDEKAEKAGAVYAFTYDGMQWHQQAKLMATDAGAVDIFGVRVSLSGDTALISARRDDVEGVGVDAGSAYIFERSNGQWSQKHKLLAPDGKADDRFGRGVSLEGDTAIISAMHNDEKEDNAGALYVYKKVAGTWTYSSKVLANDGAVGDRLGGNVALSENHAIIASPNRADNGKKSGAVYIQRLVN
ncbi:FG-GAP repeat protein [Pseudoteredinibacter isoporae]|uniref:FG-GAP repeat protein n=1 Tax=Pseudoteredinibacter isoporae TaxID=570281 RepID=UPI003104ACFB